MPTYHVSVLKHQQRESDNKYPVSIRITHNRKSAYLKTDYYVVKQQLNKDFEIKDRSILQLLFNKINECDELVVKGLGNSVSDYDAKGIVEYIKKKMSNNGGVVDFIAFADRWVVELKAGGRMGRAGNIVTSFNALRDFVGSDSYGVDDVTSDFLRRFEKFLSSERVIIRKDQFGKDRKTKCAPMTATGLHRYLSDLRAVFNRVLEYYNDTDNGDIVIKHNPFKKYKIPQEAVTRKRNILIEDVRRINGLPDGGRRHDVGRDVFMLSFYLVGINTVDLYNMEYSCLQNGRLVYHRSKTESRRSDGALISIKIEPEVLRLFEKYIDPDKKYVFNFYHHYSGRENFNAAVNKGLKQVADKIGLGDLTAYAARHSWATIARNKLNVQTDDIALCLNHVNEGYRVTDIYIEKDFTRIDVANRKMIDLLNERGCN